MIEPYKHQIEANEFIADKDYNALFMEQGTGKSKVAITKIEQLYNQGKINRVIIISPNSVKDQWVDEQFPLHFNQEYKGIVWDGFTTNKSRMKFYKLLDSDKLVVFSINVDAFQTKAIDIYIKLFLTINTYIIVDESTKIKNGSRKGRGKRRGALRTNKILDLFEKAKYKSILTGTPITKSPMDLWSQFEFLHKDFFGMDYFYFQHHYSIMIKKHSGEVTYPTIIDEVSFNILKNKLNKLDTFTNDMLETIALQYNIKVGDLIRINKMDKYTPYKNLDELHDKISKVTFFIKKKDCLDLPDKVYEKLYTSLSSEQLSVYNKLKQNMYAEYDNKELTVLNKVVMSLRLQMITGGLFPYLNTEIKLNDEGEEFYDIGYKYKHMLDVSKISCLIDDLENNPNDISTIIWARFTGEIELIYRTLINNKYTAEMYKGDSPASTITRFKNKEFQILVANPLKGSEGLNLQVATVHYFYSNLYRPDLRLQAEDRSHRSGQTSKVTYKDIICKNTIDEKIYKSLINGERLIDFFRTKNIGAILD